MRVSSPCTHFTAESTEAMWIKCLAQGHDILMSGFEQLTSVARNRHSNHMTNMLKMCTMLDNPGYSRMLSDGVTMWQSQHCQSHFHIDMYIYIYILSSLIVVSFN